MLQAIDNIMSELSENDSQQIVESNHIMSKLRGAYQLNLNSTKETLDANMSEEGIKTLEDLQVKLFPQFIEISTSDTDNNLEKLFEKSRLCALIAKITKDKLFTLHATTHLLGYLDIFISSQDISEIKK